MKALKVLGWIFVPYIMVFAQWKGLAKGQRILGGIWAAFALFAGISATASGGNQSTQPATAAVTTDKTPATVSKPKPKVDPNIAYRKRVQAFINKLNQTEKPATNVINTAMVAIDGMSKGTVDELTTYDTIKAARDKCHDVQYTFGTMSVPDGLPSDVSDQLKKALDDLSTAYYTKADGMDKVLNYLNSNQIGDLSKAKDNFDMANQFLISAAAEIEQAKIDVGMK